MRAVYDGGAGLFNARHPSMARPLRVLAPRVEVSASGAHQPATLAHRAAATPIATTIHIVMKWSEAKIMVASGARRQAGRSRSEKAPQDSGQFVMPKRLLQHGAAAMAVPHVQAWIAGREKEWHASRGEDRGDAMAFDATQVQIQHGGVKNVLVDPGEGLFDGGGGDHIIASELGQHVFDQHQNHHFVLDDEDATAGKQLVHSEAPRGAGISIVQTTPSGG
jgi:hypothetical protein